MASKQQYVRQYNAFRGVDFTSDPVDVADYRVQYAVNMWRDYENNNGSMIETIPGFRKLFDDIPDKDTNTNAKLNGLHQYRTTDADGNIIDYLIIHFGRRLHALDITNKKALPTTIHARSQDASLTAKVKHFMENKQSKSVLANNKLWIIDGVNMFSIEPYDDPDKEEKLKAISVSNKMVTEPAGVEGAGTTVGSTPYIPILFSDGEEYEDINLFVSRGRERFNNVSVKLEKDGDFDVAKYYIKGINGLSKVFLDNVEINRESSTIRYEFDNKKFVVTIKAFDGTTQKNLVESDLLNKVLMFDGLIGGMKFSKSNKYPTFNDAYPDMSAVDAILKCTSIAVFDGKIFLTGNPELPNIVFFSSTNATTGANDPSYIGAHNWLNTGVGMTVNRDMVASQGVLMVFKGDTVQDGSIYYLSPFNVEKEGIKNIVPRFYMPTEGTAGIGCIGGAINFMDDTVFITKRGLDAVGKQLTNLERSIVHRSTNVDRKLLAEDLKNIRMVEWKGYLVISVNGHMYLADSRATYVDSTGNMQYEWFYLEGIGSYLTSEFKDGYYRWNDHLSNVYRYWSGELPTADGFKDSLSGISVKPNNNEEIIEGTLDTNGEGENKVWVSLETDEKGTEVKYLCYPSGEKTANKGAEFFPAEYLCVINDVLYFGTKQGGIYVFNTDKRGEIPESIMTINEKGEDVWNDNEYDSKEDFVGWIPQEYYSFDGLKYPSGIITKTDNVGVPYAVKNTINRSLVLRVGADPRTHSTITVEVLTDRQPTFDVVDKKESTESSFGMQDYEASSFDTYPFAFLTYREHKRKWIEKRYKIYNDAFCGILRLHSLSYRYEIGGNIK